MNINLSGTRYDWIAVMWIVLIMSSYCYVWNKWLCEWLLPNKEYVVVGDIIIMLIMGIIFSVCWFLFIGLFVGTFGLFDWVDKKNEELKKKNLWQ